MRPRRYRVQGGDDACYGPRFGPVVVEELRHAPMASGDCIVVRLLAPIVIKAQRVSYIALAPRHVGDTVETIQAGSSTVNIGRVRQREIAKAKTPIAFDNCDPIAIGTSEPVPTNTTGEPLIGDGALKPQAKDKNAIRRRQRRKPT